MLAITIEKLTKKVAIGGKPKNISKNSATVHLTNFSCSNMTTKAASTVFKYPLGHN
jgi:hypothetical protein